MTIGVSIYGIVESNKADQAIINTACEFLKIYDMALYGNLDENWAGIDQLESTLNSTIRDLKSSETNICYG